ncbi:MAG: hypothetical protein AAGA86_13765 [Bacteroidota bacterium]
MKISSEKAAILCHKVQYGEATFWDRIRLRLYLVISKSNANYTKKNTRLTVLCEKANLHSLSEKEKQAMKQRLQEKI